MVPLDIFLNQEVRMDVISSFTARYERSREEEMSLEDYLAECKRNPLAYATAAERMLKAIGEPKTIDTHATRGCRASSPTRSSRSTPPSPSSTAWRTPSSRWCPTSPCGAGPEEKKQILYPGPVGGGESSRSPKG